MMKKFLRIAIASFMIASSSNAMAYEIQLDIAEKVVVSESETVYRSLKTKEDGEMVAKVNIPQSLFDSGIESAKLYVASYSGTNVKELDKIAVKDITSADAGLEIVTPAIAVDANQEVRAYLWDGTTVKPISMKDELPSKETALFYDFENFKIGDTINDSSISLKGSLVTAAADPEEGGTRGNVAKFLGTYDAVTGSTTGWEFNIHELKTNRTKINQRGGTVAVDYEYDLYIPREYAYDKADGSDYKANTIFQIKFGEYRMAAFQMMICTDNNRIQFQNMSDRVTSGWVNYQNWADVTGKDLYDRWIPMKIETRPFVTINPETGKEVVTNDYSESFIYFDGVCVGHVIGKNNAVSAFNTAYNGIEGRLYFSCNGAGYSVSRAVYMDNFKVSL